MHTAAELPWLIDNDRVTRWYYRDAPAVGSVIHYANESYIDTVERVSLTHVWLTSGTAMRRPYIGRRLVRWSINRIRNHNSRRLRSTYSAPATARSTPFRVDVTPRAVWSVSTD